MFLGQEKSGFADDIPNRVSYDDLYNPVDPQIGFVGRYAELVGFTIKIGMILTVGIYLGLSMCTILLFWRSGWS